MNKPAGVTARDEVLRQLANAHDRLAAKAIDLQRKGKTVESIGARAIAARLMKAWEAEMYDPRPEGLR